MDKKVLVAYATKCGATAGIAAKIGEVLRQSGPEVDVLPVSQANGLDNYAGVVLGSAVYIGQWRKGAAKFLKTHEAALAKRPVWLFSSGPTGEGDPLELVQNWRFPGKLQPIADRIGPRDTAVFHGATDESQMNWLEKWMLNNIGSPAGDFRDWEAIATWAETIAAELKEA